VISERGHELERKITGKLDDLLYWIFSGVTFWMACDFERNNRLEDKDFRRIAFEKQEELLGILNQGWQQKMYEEHEEILKNHTFDDLAGLRAEFCRELREKGFSEIEIEKLAYEKYRVV